MERLTQRGKENNHVYFTRRPKGFLCGEDFCSYSYKCDKIKDRSCPYLEVMDRLAAYEDTGLEPQEIERIVDAYGRCQTLRTESALRLQMIREISNDRLQEIAEAERDGRCFVLPKDGMVYYIEEAGGEKWIANKPIQQITIKCGWGIASLEFSLFDTGKYFSREAADAALKGENK